MLRSQSAYGTLETHLVAWKISGRNGFPANAPWRQGITYDIFEKWETFIEI